MRTIGQSLQDTSSEVVEDHRVPARVRRLARAHDLGICEQRYPGGWSWLSYGITALSLGYDLAFAALAAAIGWLLGRVVWGGTVWVLEHALASQSFLENTLQPVSILLAFLAAIYQGMRLCTQPCRFYLFAEGFVVCAINPFQRPMVVRWDEVTHIYIMERGELILSFAGEAMTLAPSWRYQRLIRNLQRLFVKSQLPRVSTGFVAGLPLSFGPIKISYENGISLFQPLKHFAQSQITEITFRWRARRGQKPAVIIRGVSPYGETLEIPLADIPNACLLEKLLVHTGYPCRREL